MLFVRADKLKAGMRLARPIYNKNGVLLYERNSKLSDQSIINVRNFGLIGLYVLEPAEPVPPMTMEDLAFERFQTMEVFAIQEELTQMLQSKKPRKMEFIVADILKNYGHMEKRVNFIQTLRSREDYIYKHVLNVAILATLMGHYLNMRPEDMSEIITAAIVHDIGKIEAKQGKYTNDEDQDTDRKSRVKGFEWIENVFASNPNIKRICVQASQMEEDFKAGVPTISKPVTGAKIMLIADLFDSMTAMQLDKEPASEITALRTLLNNSKYFDSKIVDTLIHTITILDPGTCIELNTGEKGLVLTSNQVQILHPMILVFRDNKIIDLSNREVYGDIEIKDIMKTMDNRHIMDTDFLKKQGISVVEPEYV